MQPFPLGCVFYIVHVENKQDTWTNIHEDLVEACLRGESKGYEKLYKLYNRAMYNISLRIVKDESEAEDVLQESFVSAFKNLSSYNRDSTFGAWLKRIVINKSINVIRKKKTIYESLQDEASDYDVVEEEAIDWSGIHLEVEMVRTCVQKLPEGYRVVFSLYALEGYDHKEIGGILGISESTSKSQYNRSKKKLKELLLSYEREG